MKKSKPCRVKQNPNYTKKDLELALKKIAMTGWGMKEDVKDWANIGRGAVLAARDVLAGKCRGCGRGQVFDPQIHAKEELS